MNFKGHLIGGSLVGSAAVIYTYQMYDSPWVPVSCGLFAVASSLYPDTDIKSTPSKIFLVGSILALVMFLIASKWLWAVIIVGLMLTSALAPHRGITHSMAFAIAFCFIIPQIFIGYFIAPLCISGLAGYLTHLVLDRHFRFI